MERGGREENSRLSCGGQDLMFRMKDTVGDDDRHGHTDRQRLIIPAPLAPCIVLVQALKRIACSLAVDTGRPDSQMKERM